MGDIKLKPCPFCGSETPKLFAKKDGKYLDIHVECIECFTQSAAYSANLADEEAAIDNIEEAIWRATDCWNRRTVKC